MRKRVWSVPRAISTMPPPRSGIATAVIVSAIMGIMVCSAFLAWVVVNRKTPIVLFSQPSFCTPHTRALSHDNQLSHSDN